ncbi:sensor histidine kinase [Chthonobacter albigriseus]|uniref:sensor histidine kinase n=1 Tax=Chthonobacter albigriseus TaxID=1683161 RepID=UPI0015EE4F85|nr:HAMP domain-containing sensor histidine kinase [Chthonobacter albigriseus]
MTEENDSQKPPIGGEVTPGRFGLSAKLLVLTVLFVMLAELLIYVPSIANFQKTGIEDRLETATVAARALSVSEAHALSPQMQATVLDELDAYALAIRVDGMKKLVAMTDMPPPVAREIDIRQLPPVAAIREAFDTLISGNNRTIRAVGPYQGDGEIEVVFSENGLKADMLAYSRNILILSIAISGLAAVLVYFSLRMLLVRPMLRVGRTLTAWLEDPEDQSRVIVPSGRRDEIGEMETRIATMQQHLHDVLKQQRRLAELGLAVSKINHDLRNLLASAQLMSDRLASIPDPTVQRFAPKLLATLDRAITYAQAVLSYGKAQELPPTRRLIALNRLVGEVGDVTGLPAHASIEWVNAVPTDLEVDADSDQLFRVLLNLVRNSAQALEQSGDETCVRRLTVAAERTGSVVKIRVLDTGPGVPEKAREHLFKPFQGSARRGGTGLGLAIAAELVRAHGGSIGLAADGPGAIFEIEIPDRPVPLGEVRRSRAS